MAKGIALEQPSLVLKFLLMNNFRTIINVQKLHAMGVLFALIGRT